MDEKKNCVNTGIFSAQGGCIQSGVSTGGSCGCGGADSGSANNSVYMSHENHMNNPENACNTESCGITNNSGSTESCGITNSSGVNGFGSNNNTAGGFEEPDNCEISTHSDSGMKNCVCVGYGYVPWQTMGNVFRPEKGLSEGTVFPELALTIDEYGKVCKGGM